MAGSKNSFVMLINEPVIDLISHYWLTVEEVFLASNIYLGNFEILNKYLAVKSPDRKRVIIQPLVRKQLVEGYKEEWKDYVFTEYGEKVIVSLLSAMKIVNTLVDQGDIGEEAKLFDKFVYDFINLFPENTKNGGNKTLKSNFTDTKHKMIKFFKKYPYDRETVLKATQHYINKFRGNFTYCPAAEYFIMKDNTSSLATECELVKNNANLEGEIVNPFDQDM